MNSKHLIIICITIIVGACIISGATYSALSINNEPVINGIRNQTNITNNTTNTSVENSSVDVQKNPNKQQKTPTKTKII
ncbi:MAG: hypothetical protein KO202_00855 [Methanobacteriaceae archaeon]|jgi:flagellar basal body-associated protein FliL|nr:hypothetical protein [Methanobacteriaceae archaeon]